MNYKTGVLQIPSKYLPAYLAGRIDGDGHVDTKHRLGIRIVYGNKYDALRDKNLFSKDNMSLYHYKSAHTYVLYLKKQFEKDYKSELSKYSLKLAP